MLTLNVSSIGSLTNLCFHAHNNNSNSNNSTNNEIPTTSFSFSLYNYQPFHHPKSTVRKCPIQSAQINASSSSSSLGAKVDEFVANSPLSPPPPRPSRKPDDWEAAKKYKEAGSIHRGRVEGFNNGGLLVRFYSLVGFLPFPQLSPSHSCKEPNKTIQEIAKGLIGSIMATKVIEADGEKKKLIFSEKEASWSKYSNKVKVGDIFEAKVGLVEDYGAFLHLRFPDGNYHLTGLVHVSEVSWDFVQDVRDVLRIGDDARAKVVNVDREKSRITLSIRQLEEDPLLETLDKVIPQDGSTNPDSAGEGFIQPLPGLVEIFGELLKEEGISDVRITRQGFEKRVVSQDLQLWLSNAPAIDNQYTLLARAGRQVQEIQMTTSLDQEGIKKALQRVLERVP